MDWNAELFKSARNGDLDKVKECLTNGADVNAVDIVRSGCIIISEKTALMYASKRGHLEIVKYLIENGADINAKSNSGETALMGASNRGHLEIVKYLIENGADINTKDNNGWTALILATYYNKLGVVKLLLQNGADINAKSNSGETALMGASNRGHLEIVKYLIENGANINAKNAEGRTALMEAIFYEAQPTSIDLKRWVFNEKIWEEFEVEYSIERTIMEKKIEVIKYLIKNGADVNIKDNGGKTALDLARTNNKCDEIEFLINAANADWEKQLFISISKVDLDKVQQCLANGADINTKDNNGWTALILATYYNKLGVVKLLLQNGADINAKSNSGETALMGASNRGHLEIVKYLIENGANINAKNAEGRTALMEASSGGHLEIVKYLIENGANINAKSNSGETALMEASKRGHLEIVKYLIENGANINAKSNSGETALMKASSGRHLEIVKYLIFKDADINAKDNDGKTALYYTHTDDIESLLSVANTNLDNQLLAYTMWGYLDAVKWCLKKGANINVKGAYGLTALMLALAGYDMDDVKFWSVDGGICGCVSGDLKIVKCLIENGIDLNVKDKYNGRTALIWAAAEGYIEAVKLLVENGADINAKDNEGNTAFDSAKTDEIALFLIDVANRNRGYV